MINRQWRLASRPEGFLKESDFSRHEEPMPEPADGEVLLRNIYLSLDPANRGWVGERATYLSPVAIDEVMRGSTISVVETSKNSRFNEGDIVQGFLGWQDYAVSDGTGLATLPRDSGVPFSDWFAVFGHVGMTAYFGLLDVGKPQEGETLLVSAAAGAVGSLVGQIGKIHGMRVVGIAGGEEKCRWITEELGFDAAIDYKSEKVPERLKECCPDGVDVHFENVAGPILEAALNRINKGARIVLCGMISQYNATEASPGPRNLVNLLMKRARIEGFIVLDYYARAMEALGALGGWLREGKLKYRVDVVEGFDEIPRAINKLFDGTNRGKLVVKLSDEP
jgi:NADPH-dependent curcumin reductase CurA